MHLTLSLNNLKKWFLPMLCCGFFVACQPPQHTSNTETKTVDDQHKVSIDLNALCNQLSHEMQQVDAQRTLFVLQQINQNLKVCLPLMTTDEQLKLLALSQKMYQRFLSVERTPAQQQAFEQYVSAVATHPTLQQQYFEQMHSRDQYLVKHQGQGYVELVTTNDGTLTYRRCPQYLARIFAPYLPEAEQVFIQGLAEQNRKVLFSHHMIQVEPMVLAERALFWQNYLERYPQSRYISDARYLFQIYSQLLFVGTQSDKVSESYRGQESIDPEHLAAIEYLAQQPRSKLSQQATAFLKFIQQDKESSSLSLDEEYQHTVEALQRELNLVSVNLKRKNCFADALCS